VPPECFLAAIPDQPFGWLSRPYSDPVGPKKNPERLLEGLALGWAMVGTGKRD